MTKFHNGAGPVSVAPIPAEMKTPDLERAFVAAQARAAEVPAGPTLIDKISNEEFLAEDDGLSIMVGTLKSPADD